MDFVSWLRGLISLLSRSKDREVQKWLMSLPLSWVKRLAYIIYYSVSSAVRVTCPVDSATVTEVTEVLRWFAFSSDPYRMAYTFVSTWKVKSL